MHDVPLAHHELVEAEMAQGLEYDDRAGDDHRRPVRVHAALAADLVNGQRGQSLDLGSHGPFKDWSVNLMGNYGRSDVDTINYTINNASFYATTATCAWWIAGERVKLVRGDWGGA